MPGPSEGVRGLATFRARILFYSLFSQQSFAILAAPAPGGAMLSPIHSHRSGSVRSAKPPVTKTCLQCGSILPSASGTASRNPETSRVRACPFCDFRSESPASQASGAPPREPYDDPAWRGELAERLASYRARRKKGGPVEGQPQLPFEQFADIPVPGINVAVAEPPATEDDFSFTIAIGRTADRTADDTQMFIDVSPPESQVASPSPAPEETQHTGLYPVAPLDERRLSGLFDVACLLFACGGFLALFGSLGGHFALSKLSAAVYGLSFAIVYLQYFALFTVFGGTTPGMMLRGLRVVDFSGEEPTPKQLLLRAAGYMLSAGTFFLGFLWVQWDEDELTWHDRISRTYLSAEETIADRELGSVAHNH
jgi:uncharacterized RDD family membrane protein YckC